MPSCCTLFFILCILNLTLILAFYTPLFVFVFIHLLFLFTYLFIFYILLNSKITFSIWNFMCAPRRLRIMQFRLSLYNLHVTELTIKQTDFDYKSFVYQNFTPIAMANKYISDIKKGRKHCGFVRLFVLMNYFDLEVGSFRCSSSNVRQMALTNMLKKQTSSNPLMELQDSFVTPCPLLQ